jgi:CheY-like chemotaxis protein
MNRRRSPSGGAASATRPRAARRILLVEDNQDTAEILCDVLVRAGHHVRVVGDGPSALRLLESYVPEVGLIDIGLPAMDGYDLVGRLRRIPGLERTPLVAVTGYAQKGDRQRALANGFTEHVAKPLDLEFLLELIERLSTTTRSRR